MRIHLLRGSASDLSKCPGDEGYADGYSGLQKRSKTTENVRDISLIPRSEAWPFNMTELLESPTTIHIPEQGQVDGHNFGKYDEQKSIFLLVVVGSMTVQLDLLRSIYASLLETSPNIQALILTPSPKDLRVNISAWPISLPIVEAQGNPANHFLKLGLLHPLGGGQQPLDAIVIIDINGKRRLVLPFGWGVGLDVSDAAMGAVIQRRFGEILIGTVQELEKERTGKRKDFYDLARNYF